MKNCLILLQLSLTIVILKHGKQQKIMFQIFTFPKDYSSCEIYNSQLIFAGIVKNSGEISLNPYDPKYCSLNIRL